MLRRQFFAPIAMGLLGTTIPFSKNSIAASPSELLWLAKSYQPVATISDYWVSEKYDGVRGHWTGSQLLTRTGKKLNPPEWFTQNWPSTPLEGELWIDRGQFQAVTSILQQNHASDAAWKDVKFMVFDIPHDKGTFTERSNAYQSQVTLIEKAWVIAVKQIKINTEKDLNALLNTVVDRGGEGLMLHLASSSYKVGRSNDQLKLKPQQDAEAQVTGYEKGQGKHAQRIGALWVKAQDGRKFKLGSGLSDLDRERPPPIGQWVTYTYRGLTSTGLPRFANYLRLQPLIAR